jgi:aldose 1-epimerase
MTGKSVAWTPSTRPAAIRPYLYRMLYTGDDRPDVRRRSMAVEPMTCPPQAFRTGRGVVRLDPGDSFRGTWGITPRVAEAVVGE